MRNIIQFEVSGRYALVIDPATKWGGEKLSYPVPAYESFHKVFDGRNPRIRWG
ncbi:MAG: hypothetical protein C7B47_13980 [Sulfobacillus thermosulfidooxidans]|uniref:Uncharacterized protein n=1 Tax=Sulfobacillus thermosulfidooxidans TaxID=28034 RepID=A0A2T2WRA8_SULTH|nr:MAG: hypothetical protein C7B47_13980 [Sulfobacillus thermosulfidooxidans]